MYHSQADLYNPGEWQDQRSLSANMYNDYRLDGNNNIYHSAAYNTSKQKKLKKKRHSINEDRRELYDRNRDYYEELQYLKQQLKQQDSRPKSTSPFVSVRDTQNRIVPENRPPSSFVNYPMIMGNPMMNHQLQGLGACTTEPVFMMPSQNDFNGMVPPPMMYPKQPYLLQPPNTFSFNNNIGFPPPFQNMVAPFQNHNTANNTIFGNHATMPTSSATNITPEKDVNTEIKDAGVIENISSSNSSTTETAAAITENRQIESAPKPQPKRLQRRRSMMDSILSAFALPNTGDVIRPQSTFVSFNETVRQMNDDEQQTIRTSDISTLGSASPLSSAPSSNKQSQGNPNVEIHLNLSNEKPSLKLQQKIHALQSRQYLWCYQAPTNMWVAFDVKNQIKLDNHYITLKAKAATGDLPDDVLVLTKQNQVPGPLYISIKSNKAWYNAPNPIVFDIAFLPTGNSRFVVPDTGKPVLKRSKSLDMTAKLFNNILSW